MDIELEVVELDEGGVKLEITLGAEMLGQFDGNVDQFGLLFLVTAWAMRDRLLAMGIGVEELNELLTTDEVLKEVIDG
jgi:hypothetical protein